MIKPKDFEEIMLKGSLQAFILKTSQNLFEAKCFSVDQNFSKFVSQMTQKYKKTKVIG